MAVDSSMDVASYLSARGVQVYRAAGKELQAHCLWCLDGDPKGRGRLYINSESWLYSCFRCGARGNRRTLLGHFGDEDEAKYAPGADPAVRMRILREAVDLSHEMLLGNDRIMEWLTSREHVAWAGKQGKGISPEILLADRVGYVPRNTGFSQMLPSREDFSYADLVTAGLISAVEGREIFNGSIAWPYYSHGQVVGIRERQPQGNTKSLPGSRSMLYNQDSLRGAGEVIVVEGETDTNAIRTAILASEDRRLQSMAVVGLPGAGSWPEGFIESLSGCKRVFIGLDPDETGKRFATKMKGELGTRGRVVELPEALPKCDFSDFLNARSDRNPHGGHDWTDLKELLVEAELAGKRLYDVGSSRLKWMRRRSEAPGLKFGWPAVDAILRPGLKPGQVVIPLARTGTGKSIFLSNIAYQLRNTPTLYLSLEMTTEEVHEHLRRIHRFHNPRAASREIDDDLRLLRIVDQNRIGPGDIQELVSEFTEEVGKRPGLLLLDYLQYYARGFRAETQHERVNSAVMEVKAVSKEESLVTIIPSQVSRGTEPGKPLALDNARDSGVVEETGDFVISIYRPDQVVLKDGEQPQQSGSLKLGLLKSRHGGVGSVFNLKLSNMSLAIVDGIDKVKSARIDQENSLVRQGVHYEDARQMQDDAIAQGTLL